MSARSVDAAGRRRVSAAAAPLTAGPVAGVAATALGVVFLLDTLRVWLPSIIFIYGEAAQTPPARMGLFALGVFLLSFVAILVARILGPRAVMAAGAVGLVLLRAGLQATQGGRPQLWLSTAAIVAGLAWLVSRAEVAAGRVAAVGIVAGLAADTTLHTLLRSTGLAWRGGLLPWAALVVAGVAFLVLSRRAAPVDLGSSARGWFALGPALVLHLLLAAMPSRLHAVTGWPEPAVAAVVLLGALGAAVLAWWATDARIPAAGVASAAFVAGGAVLALAAPSTLVALGHVLLPWGIGLAVAATLSGQGDASPPLRALACAGGQVTLLALAFLFYASYDLALPIPRGAVVGIAAVVLGLIAVVAPLPAPTADLRRTGLALPLVAALLGVLAGSGTVALAAERLQPRPGDGFPVRVVLYNLHMGFDVEGRHSVDRLADAVAAENPDVVGLNEVSRGWAVNASTDTLPRLAERVGQPWAFAPAADRAWGNAALSRYPLRDVRVTALPQGEAPMARSVLTAVLDLGGGRALGVVVTHVHHRVEGADIRLPQVEVVAAEARRLADAGLPVVVLGDLNAEPGSRELAPLESWLTSVADGQGPIATFPSWAPEVHIDHIFVTPDLRAGDYTLIHGPASDHLGVAVTVEPAN